MDKKEATDGLQRQGHSTRKLKERCVFGVVTQGLEAHWRRCLPTPGTVLPLVCRIVRKRRGVEESSKTNCINVCTKNMVLCLVYPVPRLNYTHVHTLSTIYARQKHSHHITCRPTTTPPILPSQIRSLL